MRHLTPAMAWLVALALPLVESPTPSDPVAPTRLLILGLAVALGLMARPVAGTPRVLAWTLLAGMAVFLVAALVSPTPLLSLLGRYPRYEGVLVVGAYTACVVIGARLFVDGVARVHLERALAASGVLTLALAVGQVVLAPGERVTGTLGNASTLGIWGLLVVCVLGWRLAVERTWWLWCGAASSLMLVVLSASRASQLALLAACGLASLLRLRTHPRPRWWLPPVTAAVLVLGVLLVPTARARVTGATPFAEATISGRTLLWQESVALVAAHPLTGAGPSCFVDSIGAFHTTAWAAAVGPYAPPDSPHNVILQLASAGGLLGLLAFGALAGVWLVVLCRRGTLSTGQGGAALAVAACTIAYLAGFTDPITTPLVCLLAGAAVGTAPPSPRGAVWPARAVAAGVLAVTLAFGGSILASEWFLSSALDAPRDQQILLRAATDRRPWDPDFRRRVAYVEARLVETGTIDASSALAGAVNLCEPLPGSVECLHTLADLQDLSGDHWGALATLEAASDLDPTNVDTVLKQGIAHAGAGDFAAAQASFERAAELRPTAPEPWENLAHLHELQGRTAEAEAARAAASALRRR